MMSQVLLAFRWYLVVQVFGLAALPLCLRLFRHLPDRGYGVSKPLGLLLAGWVFWLLTTFGWTHNTVGGILVALALVALAGTVLYLTNQPTNENQPTDEPTDWTNVLVTEAVFTLAFIAWCLVRARMPQIQTAGGEKWMEIAFLRAILRSDTFPPHDPWLSGFAISYYYFGYVIVAMLTRLAAVPPPIAFNLGIATLFALTCTGAFSLVYNLILGGSTALTTGGRNQVSAASGAAPSLTKKPGFSANLGGLLGPLLVAVMGNLEGLLEVLHARGAGPGAFWAWLDIRGINGSPPPLVEGSWAPTRFFWWWQASRVVRDYDLRGAAQEVIDEFPAFSFILGDMHPHVLALPFVLLALALALNLYLRIVNVSCDYQVTNGKSGINEIAGTDKNDSQLTKQPRVAHNSQFAIRSLPFASWEFVVYALCLGGLGFLNTWDFPIYLVVVTAAYGLGRLCGTRHATRIAAGRYSLAGGYVLRAALLALAFLLAGILLYLPFWIGFQSQAGGILPNPFNATRLPQFLVMFGPLAFIVAVFVADQARRGGVRAPEVAKWTLIVALSILGVLVLVLGFVVVMVRLGVIPSQGPVIYLAAWLRGDPIPYLEDVANAHALVSQRLLLRLLSPWTALGLIALLVTIALLVLKQFAIRNSQFAIRNFVLLLLAVGALLALSVEYVYLRDNFGTRMNTVFKFYFQAWVLWGIAGAYALARFLRRGSVMASAAALLAALLIAAGLIYPVLAIPARANEYGGPTTLDGAAYMAEVYPDDYPAIAWLDENVSGAPVVLETPGEAYDYEGRVSAHTGLPTLLGWSGHEGQWRGSYEEQNRRGPDIETLYTSVNPVEVLSLLDEYGISYIYVGPRERARYLAAGLAKFAGMMEIVYDTGAVTIYRYYPVTDDQP